MARKGYTKKPCPGCGDDQWHRPIDSVCNECKKKLEYATASVSEEQERKDLIVVAVPKQDRYHNLPYVSEGRNELPSSESPLHLLQKQVLRLFTCFRRVTRDQADEFAGPDGDRSEWEVIFKGIQPRYMESRIGNRIEPCYPLKYEWGAYDADYYLVPKRLVPALQIIYRSLAEVSHYRYREGYDDGHNLLMQLAAGESSLEDYNQATIQETPWPQPPPKPKMKLKRRKKGTKR